MPKDTSLALRLLKEQQARLSGLRAALVEGENSGPATAFDFDRFIAGNRKNGFSADKGLRPAAKQRMAEQPLKPRQA